MSEIAGRVWWFAAVSAAALVVSQAVCPAAEAVPPGKFVEVAKDDVGGHYFSQVIYAPTIEGLVSWGTRTHSGSTPGRRARRRPGRASSSAGATGASVLRRVFSTSATG